ncbi:uncharacterized protein [Aristolochia californica]|uniref:uncharacterized protein n=1 Tax=Aristolochia californica TaxID=171875 RepID=UPI0035E07448
MEKQHQAMVQAMEEIKTNMYAVNENLQRIIWLLNEEVGHGQMSLGNSTLLAKMPIRELLVTEKLLKFRHQTAATPNRAHRRGFSPPLSHGKPYLLLHNRREKASSSKDHRLEKAFRPPDIKRRDPNFGKSEDISAQIPSIQADLGSTCQIPFSRPAAHLVVQQTKVFPSALVTANQFDPPSSVSENLQAPAKTRVHRKMRNHRWKLIQWDVTSNHHLPLAIPTSKLGGHGSENFFGGNWLPANSYQFQSSSRQSNGAPSSTQL